MAAATTPKPDTIDATAPETPVVPVAEVVAAPVAEVVTSDFSVLRTFTAHVKTQLLTFQQGDTITGDIGGPLYATGAPLKPLS